MSYACHRFILSFSIGRSVKSKIAVNLLLIVIFIVDQGTIKTKLEDNVGNIWKKINQNRGVLTMNRDDLKIALSLRVAFLTTGQEFSA